MKPAIILFSGAFLVLLILSGCTEFKDYHLYQVEIEISNETDVTQLFSIYSDTEDKNAPEISDILRDISVPPHSTVMQIFRWIPGKLYLSDISGETEDNATFSALCEFRNSENENMGKSEIQILIKGELNRPIYVFDSPLKSQYSEDALHNGILAEITDLTDKYLIKDLYSYNFFSDMWELDRIERPADSELSYEEFLDTLVSPVLERYSIEPEPDYVLYCPSS